MRLKRKGQEGQSTFEFLLVFAFSLGILFVFVQTAIIFTSGYLTHYATFMASRTYLVWDRGNADPEPEYKNDSSLNAIGVARKVFDSYQVKVLGARDPNGTLEFLQRFLSGTHYEFTGVKYKYSQPLSLMSFIGGNITSQMISESFLGKEPPRGECYKRVIKVMKDLNIPQGLDKFTTNFDNGC